MVWHRKDAAICLQHQQQHQVRGSLLVNVHFVQRFSHRDPCPLAKASNLRLQGGRIRCAMY